MSNSNDEKSQLPNHNFISVIARSFSDEAIPLGHRSPHINAMPPESSQDCHALDKSRARNDNRAYRSFNSLKE